MSEHGDATTFLLTDVEGSTQLWEAHRDAMSRALARHDAIAGQVVRACGGQVVKARGEGDSLFLVFDDPATGLEAACTIQRALAEEPWPEQTALAVRMALHVGEAEMRADDYYGPTVNRCARLRSIGHGGQILLTEAAREAVSGRTPPGVRLLDLGAHALRDISGSERVYQVVCDGLRCDFPPLRSPGLTPTNLPFRRNPSLVGRDEFILGLHRALLPSDRVPVAIVGITGIGKTQVAVEYAHRYLADYPSGVFWLNAGGADRLVEEMAGIGRLLDVPDHPSAMERAQRVRDALQRLPEPSLLVLDNVTEDADLTLVPAVGRCRVLVTTVHRHLVRHVFRCFAPMPLDEGSALGLLRGSRRDPIPDEDLAARQIAHRLGFLPLALALVANHVDRLGLSFREYCTLLVASPMEVLARARRRFSSDTGHDGSIYDAIRISYGGLEPDAQAVLKAAACFAGRGISPALLMLASRMASQIDFDEALADLTDHFLVEREQGGRLSVHELVREFASTEMTDEEGREVAGRVATVLAEVMAPADVSNDWAPVRSEFTHAVVAANLCRARGAREPLRAVAVQLGEYAMSHGDHAGAVAWFDEALAIARGLHGHRSRQAAEALRELGWACAEMGGYEGAKEAAGLALEIASEVLSPGDPDLAEYENSYGYVLKGMGDLDTALPHYQRALVIVGQAKGRRDRKVARLLNNIGNVLESQGDLEGALRLMREALDIDSAQKGVAPGTIGIRLNNIGRVLGQLGQWEAALDCHRRAAESHEAAYGPQHPDVAGSFMFAGRACRMLGRSDEAALFLEDAKAICLLFRDASRPILRKVEDELAELRARQEGNPR